MNKEKLKEIVKQIDEIGEELKVTFSSDMVLDCSTRIYISNMIAEQRGNRENEPQVKNSSSTSQQTPSRPINPLSSAQLSAMKSAVENDLYNEEKHGKIENMSKQKAFEVIRDLKNGVFKWS